MPLIFDDKERVGAWVAEGSSTRSRVGFVLRNGR
jgi:hypothetical protein